MSDASKDRREDPNLRFLDEAVRAHGDGLVAIDANAAVVYWSDRVGELTGLARADVIGRQIGEVFPNFSPEEAARVRGAIGGQPQGAAIAHLTAAGETHEGVFESSYAPLRDAGGAVIGATILLRDVTAQELVEHRLRETERRFQNMADASPVLLWMSGTDSLCSFFNATWLTFTGRTLDQELGVGWAEGVHFEDFQRCIDTYEEAFGARRDFTMEYRLRRADGEYRWLLDRGTPRYLPDGRFAGFIGSCVDITEHKHLEARLRQAVRERDDFMSIAAHELRTPLTPLSLALEKMQRQAHKAPEDLDPHRLRSAADGALANVKRVTALVEELLDVSRLTGGRTLELAKREFDLADLAVDATLRFAESARDAGCSIEVEAATRVTGFWDPQRIDRAITNLIANAIKYGAGAPIVVSVRADEKRAIVAVKDHGIGIDPADHERIFGRFERAVSMRNYGGFGLGLWIVRQLAEAHDGTVAVESQRGAGSTFTMVLPRGATAPNQLRA
jgi:PAS domain S-box-containing protein